MKRNIKLVIEFDGTAYHGWQSQENAVTVQDTLTAAVRRLTGENCSITGSSRTDTGVHALGFVCNFFTGSPIPADKFSFALNTMLPDDIRVVSSEEVPGDFHSRFSAKGKRYLYYIYNSTFASALLRHRAYHVYYPLDVDEMDRAAKHFIGTHDFLAFSASGYSAKTTVRTITEAKVSKVSQARHFVHPKGGQLIEFSVTGNGFLYNMVRIMAGTLVEVGFGKIRADDIPGILAGLDRRQAGRTAPPHGLYLAEVFY
ncbi:MAG: tRNA pseudouridine(38-40) synthase TruA [Clostridiaceae bacterium]|jgi:tRNA pseudouridine38-40 synthase|nr:tRNA pseudouridine(38-40) synthase TruA [Clostridiaceae bacterium]